MVYLWQVVQAGLKFDSYLHEACLPLSLSLSLSHFHVPVGAFPAPVPGAFAKQPPPQLHQQKHPQQPSQQQPPTQQQPHEEPPQTQQTRPEQPQQNPVSPAEETGQTGQTGQTEETGLAASPSDRAQVGSEGASAEAESMEVDRQTQDRPDENQQQVATVEPL